MSPRAPRLHPSILSADFARLAEELGRIRAHLFEANGLAGKRAPGGRNLEFLIQELQREVNTVGSKSSPREVQSSTLPSSALRSSTATTPNDHSTSEATSASFDGTVTTNALI